MKFVSRIAMLKHFRMPEKLTAKIWLSIVFVSIIVSVVKVNIFWQTAQNQIYPDRGDYDFYLQVCTNMPAYEHPVVPAMLYTLNFFIRNPHAAVLCLTIAGFASVFTLIFVLLYSVTSNIWSAFFGFTFILVTPGFLSFTAMKNLYAVVFLLVSLIFLERFRREHQTNDLVLLVFLSSLTCFSHSIPIIVLLVVFAVYAVQQPKFTILLAAFSGLFLTTLAATRRTQKLQYAQQSFSGSVVTNNVNRLMKYAMKAPYLLLFVVALSFGLYHQLRTRKVEPLFMGLAVAAGGLLLCGPDDFSIRLYNNAMPLLVLLFGYWPHFYMDLKNKHTGV